MKHLFPGNWYFSGRKYHWDFLAQVRPLKSIGKKKDGEEKEKFAEEMEEFMMAGF